MRAVVLDSASAGLEQLLEARRRSGLDRLDEMWEGELHMAPAPRDVHADIAQQLAVLLDGPARAAGLFARVNIFNLGEDDRSYRVPDGGIFRQRYWGAFAHTAALVIEIVSQGDESWAKLPFYAIHEVDEVLVVDPQKRSVDWMGLQAGEYRRVQSSGLIALGPEELAQRIDWPRVEPEEG